MKLQARPGASKRTKNRCREHSFFVEQFSEEFLTAPGGLQEHKKLYKCACTQHSENPWFGWLDTREITVVIGE